jgi:hypothetical protein
MGRGLEAMTGIVDIQYHFGPFRTSVTVTPENFDNV